MRGFTKEVLIILPSADTYLHKDFISKLSFDSELRIVLTYIQGLTITPFFFNNNELAVVLHELHKIPFSYQWISAFVKEDELFAKRGFIENLTNPPFGRVYEEFETLVRKQVKSRRGLTEQERFDLVVKRCRILNNLIINDFKFVITFETKTNEVYKVRSGYENDERIIWRYKAAIGSFESYMSGKPFSINTLTNYEHASRPLSKWEVEVALNCI